MRRWIRHIAGRFARCSSRWQPYVAACGLRRRLDLLAAARHAPGSNPGQRERRDSRGRRNPPLRDDERRVAESARRQSAGHRPHADAAGPHPQELRAADSRVSRDQPLRRTGRRRREQPHRQAARDDSEKRAGARGQRPDVRHPRRRRPCCQRRSSRST